ncbi:cold shock domain-containing protein [Candidatus Giovannonibacteria bacterium]|nr:cold shock domain-containing protein [Candidatus Giovannonibacteria bacterium]
MKGKVRWFNNGKAYGRIVGENKTEYHVHFSQVATHGSGFHTLDEGEEVEFIPIPITQSGRLNLPEAKKVKPVRERMRLPELAAERTSNRNLPLEVVDIRVYTDGRIFLPERENEADPRDYKSDSGVRALYFGHPASIRKSTRIAVELPEKQSEGVTLLPTDFNGGALTHGEWVYDFPRGGFVLVMKKSEDGNYVSVSAKKVSIRLQDSTSMVDRRDLGCWVVVETPFQQTLEIPSEYADDRDLARQLEEQIIQEYPDFAENRKASFRKFGPAIARAICPPKKRRSEVLQKASPTHGNTKSFVDAAFGTKLKLPGNS